ncbi:hypothetical protein CALCODRAFT_504403 [Calocera cornea HHB12733]|uniref:Uncharacterized protein n=1 Tax=Calocera cornea HHB12733 TaxID=1353952 RepID=A0A165CG51_9BASI|nr:hypothetical protein CALCODRAFT_504403 [Calocera cornea HHB12733]
MPTIELNTEELPLHEQYVRKEVLAKHGKFIRSEYEGTIQYRIHILIKEKMSKQLRLHLNLLRRQKGGECHFSGHTFQRASNKPGYDKVCITATRLVKYRFSTEDDDLVFQAAVRAIELVPNPWLLLRSSVWELPDPQVLDRSIDRIMEGWRLHIPELTESSSDGESEASPREADHAWVVDGGESGAKGVGQLARDSVGQRRLTLG